MREDASGRVGGEESGEVPCRYSRPTVRSGQGRLQVLEMYLKSGGVPTVQSGAMISMGRLLEKLGPSLTSPEFVEGQFCELRLYGVHRRSRLRLRASVNRLATFYT